MKIYKRILAGIALGSLLFTQAPVYTQAVEAVGEIVEMPVDNRPNYAIYVNRSTNCVTVKVINEDSTETAVKSMICSTGRNGHRTPVGTFSTSDYYDWRLMVDGTYGRYAVRFNNRIMFHSVPYYSKREDNLEYEQYNLLGENASLGCVRLAVADAKWIYDNCRKGTKVVVYENEEDYGEPGKPAPIRIDVDSPFRGWDPTDPIEINPWRNNNEQ
ncbi:MAG: L,D-transpeptidase [Lachnospiraceae bacterium]|nr:L,D-transpeptidase [Lachnospiraceae bacterium]